ncbi:YdeI family protein [Duganella sp. BuS-21]|uniref:YdeI/OmpD-associated family protein n=1 Tax=Duganella sp. BuS-21 TaxID=2943848 RepID=UPI0035A694FC
MSTDKVDAFLERAKNWREEFEALRAIITDSDLTEDLKWGQPCYTLDGHNIVLMHGFKEYCALLFFKGALMKDPKNLLIQQTENVQAARQIRFKGLADIKRQEKVLKSYVKDAIALEKSGAKVEMKKTTEFSFPEELERKMDELPALRTAFEELTPGRQRAYLLHFSSAKQQKTREARIEKNVQRILDGKGLDD